MNVSAISSAAAVAPPRTPHLSGAALRAASPEVQRSAAASQFEAILVRQLLGKTMSSMLGGSEGGAASSVYGDMLTDTLAQQLTAGKGLGLGRLLEQQLAPRKASAAVSDPSLPLTSAAVDTPLAANDSAKGNS